MLLPLLLAACRCVRCAGRSSLRTCGPAWGSRTQYRTKYCVFVSSGPTLWERLDCDVMSQQMKRGKHWSNLALHLRISTAAVPLQITISQAEWQDKVRRCCSPRTAHQSAPSMKSGHARTYAHTHLSLEASTRARAAPPCPALQLLWSPRAGQLLFIQPPLTLTAQIAAPGATSEPTPGNPSSNRVISMFPIAVILQ